MIRCVWLCLWLPCVAFAAQENKVGQAIHIDHGETKVLVRVIREDLPLNKGELIALLEDTEAQLNNAKGLLATLSSAGEHTVPAWLFDGLAKCEAWFQRTEGKVSCRNGALYQYWHQYVAGDKTLERREARKLARASRITPVTLNAPEHIIMPADMPDGPFWNVDVIHDALIVERLSRLIKQQVGNNTAFSVQLNDTFVVFGSPSQTALPGQEADATPTGPFASATLNTTSITVVDGAKELGVLDSSDGWPSSGLTAHAIAPDVFDAAIAARLAVVTNTTQLHGFLENTEEVLIKTTDQKGRVNTSDGYFAFLRGGEVSDVTELNIDVSLPHFNVSNYHGPYASVWITDGNATLVKSLLLRGDSQRWLTELRVWWRKIGRTHEDFIDGFAGATRKNKPLHVHWDGFDEQGRPVTDKKLVLNVEVAREDGGRNYQKIPLDLDALIKQPLHATGKGEIGDITVSL